MDLSGYRFERLNEDVDLVLYRGVAGADARPLILLSQSAQSSRLATSGRLKRELELAGELDPAWALRPLALTRHDGRAGLILEDPGGQTLDRLLGSPMDLGQFLTIAIGLCSALREVHARGLIHKDIKPANILVDEAGEVRLTGFGIATHLLSERQALAGPAVIAGSFPYMSPEQTGRMNRVIDHRSDLYALGVTLYEMLVGALPFAADAPLDWIHCHIARLPPPPSVRVDGVPPTLEAVILKLLAKSAEDRYQTAAGVEHDLRRFREAWRADRNVGPFPLAERDRPHRLIAPQKLFGRDVELGVVGVAFDTVVKRGKFELLLISGPSGVGKSAVINELQPSLHSARALFATGKFDPQKRDIPYATIADAFRGLLRQILGEDDAALAEWRATLANAVGSCGQLIADLLPELSLILGPLQTPPLLSANDEKARFQLIFRRFIGAFAKPDHPLVLALDDLQWLDRASLDLLARLATEDETPHMLVICAYRTEKAESPKPLASLLEAVRRARGDLKEIQLAPLGLGDVIEYVANALQEDPVVVRRPAEVIFQKTGGNPFFVAQFLAMLDAAGALTFDARSAAWSWDLDAVKSQAITDNVADLMAEKLSYYDPAALTIITTFACLGLSASKASLSRTLSIAESALDDALRPFVDADLIHRLEDGYAFAHSGVREAAYARIPAEDAPAAHLAIGRALSRGLSDRALEEGAFEIVHQFNRGVNLVVDEQERRWLADLNLIAGKRAKAATAYEAALAYLEAGAALLTSTRGSAQLQTLFELSLHASDCRFVLGDIAAAEATLVAVRSHCHDLTDLAKVVGRQMILLTYTGRSAEAIALAVDCLSQMGVDLPRVADPADVEREYQAFAQRMASQTIEDLIALPPLTDPHWLEVMILLEELQGPVATLHADLLDLILLRMANISIDHGASPETCHAFVNLGARILGWRFGAFEDGDRFGRLAIRMMEERGLDRYAARVYAISSGVVAPWSQPLREAYDIARRAIEMPQERGGIGYSGYAWVCGLTALLGCGERLSDLQRLIDVGMAAAQRSKFGLVIEFITAQQLLVSSLRGDRDDRGGELSGFSDGDYEAFLENAPTLLHAMTRYLIRKLQFLVFAGRGEEAMPILKKVGGNLGNSPILLKSPVFEIAEYCFFSALARADHLTSVPPKPQERHLEALRISGAQLAEWALRCPANFADRAHLVAAEIARLEGRDLDAERLYERAIQSARQQGFVQNEALANERAARFHAGRNLETIALTYLRNARECYELWGADAKVRQLEAANPRLAAAPASDPASRRLQQYDIQALIGMYQAVSQEIVLEQLIERLMVLAVEHAGAVRGLLVLQRGGEMQIVAEAVSRADAVRLIQRDFGDIGQQMPISILNYVARTQQPVILDDAQEPNPHGADPYVAIAMPRSVLCLPLVKQQRLVGALYLENGLASHIFTPERLSLLQLLASQAAISIENAELFRNVQQAQEQARQVGEDLKRNFDLMPVMAWRTTADGILEVANKRWHDYTGMSEIEAQDWLNAFHPDDVEKVSVRWRHLMEFRTSGEVEARMRRFDGQYRNFLVRAAPVRDESGAVVKWFGTNTDIEDLKRAEEAQEALARVSRLTAMGELTVSIAHEVNQPLMAIVTNAASCVRWLTGNVIDIDEARAAAERIIRDGHRAGDVIASIRAMARKAPTQYVDVDINEVIAEAVTLARNELSRRAIVVETRLAAEAGRVLGDRVQIQQVVLNLIMNGIEAMDAVDPAARLLLVRTEPMDDATVQVSVADTGQGVNPTDVDRIFDAFFTTKLGGTGMGLSICRSIIESHGGRMTVAANPGGGSTFTFQVPAFVEERPLVRLP